MTFEEFCTSQFIGGSDKQAFKRWLGVRAAGKKTELEWLLLFARWLNRDGG